MTWMFTSTLLAFEGLSLYNDAMTQSSVLTKCSFEVRAFMM